MVNERRLNDDELALVYSPRAGMRIEMPIDEMPVGFEGAMIAAFYTRLRRGGEWADEFQAWVMSQLPPMPMH